MKIFFLYSLLFSLPVQANQMLDGLENLEKGNFKSAVKNLNSIRIEHPDFFIAFTELQKIYYRNQNWSQFFANAIFYRQNVLKNKKSFIPELLELETLALSRHCRFKEAAMVIVAAQKFGVTPQIEKAKKFLNAYMAYQDIHLPKASASSPPVIFSDDLYWRINPAQLKKITHPKNLRVFVESRCLKKGGQS